MEKKPENDQFLLAEYSALREEIVKRIELEYQIINIALLTFGALCGIVLQYKSSLAIMLYPLLCVFLASAWVNSDTSILYIAKYIKNQIEAQFGEGTTGWEHHFELKKPYALSTLSVGGTFVGTSIFAILIGGISLAKRDPTEDFLLILAIISLMYSIILLTWYFSKRRNSTTISIKNDRINQQNKRDMQINERYP